MTIKKASDKEDLQIIEKLAREIIPDFYADIIPPEHNLFFVEKFQTIAAISQQINNGFEYYLLSDDNDFAGYFGIQVVATDSAMVLSKLYLLKQCRGLGYGTKAMDFIIKRAKELKRNSIVLTVNRQNTRTIKLYEKYGFIITKELVNKFENGMTVLDYEMTRYL